MSKGTVGEAFTEALHDRTHEWAIQKQEPEAPDPSVADQCDDDDNKKRPSNSPKRNPGGGSNGGTGCGRHGTPTKTPKPGARTDACNKWNDKRGCTKTSPDGNSHYCDYKGKGGQLCEATGHMRTMHMAHPEWPMH